MPSEEDTKTGSGKTGRGEVAEGSKRKGQRSPDKGKSKQEEATLAKSGGKALASIQPVKKVTWMDLKGSDRDNETWMVIALSPPKKEDHKDILSANARCWSMDL